VPDPPKHTIWKIHEPLDQLSDGGTRGNQAHVDLLLARKTDSSNRCNALACFVTQVPSSALLGVEISTDNALLVIQWLLSQNGSLADQDGAIRLSSNRNAGLGA
jgi:hypothetical protein